MGVTQLWKLLCSDDSSQLKGAEVVRSLEDQTIAIDSAIWIVEASTQPVIRPIVATTPTIPTTAAAAAATATIPTAAAATATTAATAATTTTTTPHIPITTTPHTHTRRPSRTTSHPATA